VNSEFSGNWYQCGVASCEGDLSPILSVLHIRVDLKLSQPERHHCNHWNLEKQADGNVTWLIVGLFTSAFMYKVAERSHCLRRLARLFWCSENSESHLFWLINP